MKKNKSFRLQLITRDRCLIDREVNFVVVPSVAGPVGVLPGHAPLLGVVNLGIMKIRDTEGTETGVFVGRGFYLVSNDGVKVVARVAERGEEIDTARAQAAEQRATDLLRTSDEGIDATRARDSLARARLRLRAASGHLT